MSIGQKLFMIFSAVLGVVIGSFLNVCIYRIPKKIFFKDERSYCPKCHHTLAWYDLFPLFSWIFLGGKCRYCKAKISIRYPIIEALNSALWVLSAYYFGYHINAFIFDIALSTLLVMTFIDIDTKEIPNGIVLIITVLGLLLFLTMPEIIWWHRLIGAIIISVPLYIIALITRGGIGGGDIKLFFAIGLMLGYKLTLVAGFLSVVLGGLIGAILLIFKKAKKGTEMPFGPFIAIGTSITIFWGENLLNLFLKLFGL